ncbi:MAG: hypothetical protein ACQEQ4_07240 [Fibrobacterota bacterium]
MSQINPRTGKRMGKFLWRKTGEERTREVARIRRNITSGYYSSPSVIEGITDDIAPRMGESLGMGMYG